MRYDDGVRMEDLDGVLVARLARVERHAGFELRITSGWRPGDDKAHGAGKAVDIACDSSRERYAIVRALLICGVERIGVYDRHVHADLWTTGPNQVLWIGVSQ